MKESQNNNNRYSLLVGLSFLKHKKPKTAKKKRILFYSLWFESTFNDDDFFGQSMWKRNLHFFYVLFDLHWITRTQCWGNRKRIRRHEKSISVKFNSKKHIQSLVRKWENGTNYLLSTAGFPSLHQLIPCNVHCSIIQTDRYMCMWGCCVLFFCLPKPFNFPSGEMCSFTFNTAFQGDLIYSFQYKNLPKFVAI